MSRIRMSLKPALLATVVLGFTGCAQVPTGPEGSVGDRASSLQGAQGSVQSSRRVYLSEEMAPVFARAPTGPQGSVGDRSSAQGEAGNAKGRKSVYTSDEMAP